MSGHEKLIMSYCVFRKFYMRGEHLYDFVSNSNSKTGSIVRRVTVPPAIMNTE